MWSAALPRSSGSWTSCRWRKWCGSGMKQKQKKNIRHKATNRRITNTNKQELITAAAEKTGFSKKDTEATLNAALETIAAALADNEKVQLVGFGSFEVKERGARIGRNPKTKEAIEIPASRAPVFKPSKALKEGLSK